MKKVYLHYVRNSQFSAGNTGLSCEEDFSVVSAIAPHLGTETYPTACSIDNASESASETSHLLAGGVAGLAYAPALGKPGHVVLVQFQMPVQMFVVATYNEVRPIISFFNFDGAE